MTLLDSVSSNLGSIFGVVGVAYGAYLTYKAARPKNEADAKKASTDVIVTYAQEWKMLYDELKIRLERLETLMDKREGEHKQEIENKNKKIDELEKRIDDLELELLKYKRK